MVIPTQGTLTILISDVEQSTALLERVGEPEWVSALRGHETDVRRLVSEHGGEVLKGTGDGFIALFLSARKCIRCALELLENSGGLRIRVGVHSGEPTFRDGDVHGRAVVKAARISAAARGGEILASGLVRELADDGSPDILWGDPRELELKGLAGTHTVHRVERVVADGRRPLRVVIADDAVIVRDGLAALLRAAGVSVDAVASDGDELLEAVDRYEPQVVITDLRMPPTHTNEGVVAAERIRADHPATAVLVLSQHADPAMAMRLLDGAGTAGTGYLLKDHISDLGLLLDALERVQAGGTVVDPEVTERMLKRRAAELDNLTRREREVLGLIAEGHSNRAIAKRLFVTDKTLEGHISRIFFKLELGGGDDENRRVAAVLTYLGRR